MNILKIVNSRLLPGMRKIGIEMPYEPVEVMQPATEHHRFIVTPLTAPSKPGIAQLRRAQNVLLIGEVTNIGPTRPESIAELEIDASEKYLQLEDPELFSKALAIITIRWNAMQRYVDIRLLGYIEEHSQSERALFSKEHINRLLELAGDEPDVDLDWISFPYEIAEKYITKARERLQRTTVPAETK